MITEDQELISASGIPKYLSQSEGIRFCCAAEMMACELDTLFCLTFHYTGCRMTEILLLKPKDIQFGLGGIVSGTLKQRLKKRHRLIPVEKRFLKRLLKYTEREGISANGRIWTFSRHTGLRRIKECMAIAEIDKARANSRTLRHSFAVSCKMQGVQLDDVQKLPGHALIKNTMIYTNIMGPEQRKLISRTWPNRFKLKIVLVFMRLKSFFRSRATK